MKLKHSRDKLQQAAPPRATRESLARALSSFASRRLPRTIVQRPRQLCNLFDRQNLRAATANRLNNIVYSI